MVFGTFVSSNDSARQFRRDAFKDDPGTLEKHGTDLGTTGQNAP